MSAPVSRVVLRRQAQLLFRRNASTTQAAKETASNTANAAKETTQQAAYATKEKAQAAGSKAQEGLSRVASSAGNVASRAGSAIGSIGGRTGRLVGAVNSLIPPTIYYSKVVLELGKIIAKEQKMSLPSGDAFSSAYRSAWSSITSGSAGNVLSSVRNMGTAQMVGLGVVGAELIGFFSVGEILGRFKLVGYRGGNSEEHH